MAPVTTGWAIAGTGNIARRFAEDMRFSSRGRIVAIASADGERAQSLARAIGPTVSAGSLDDVLGNPEVNAVYVAGRNEMHCEHALRSLEKGKPVLIEKPFASSLAEAESIVERARSLGILVMEAMWMRFIPAMRVLSERIERGEIGEVKGIQAALSFANPQPAAAVTPDLGVYPISLSTQFLGVPRSAAAAQTSDGRQVAITLTYEHALASLVCGFDAEGANRATIVGTKGILTTGTPLFSPALLSNRQTGSVTSPTREGPLAPFPRFAWGNAARQVLRPFRDRRQPIPYRGNGLHYQADHFCECLEAGLAESPIMPLQQSLEVIRVVDEVERILASR